MELFGGLWSWALRKWVSVGGVRRWWAAARAEGSDKEMRLGKWLRQVGGGTQLLSKIMHSLKENTSSFYYYMKATMLSLTYENASGFTAIFFLFFFLSLSKSWMPRCLQSASELKTHRNLHLGKRCWCGREDMEYTDASREAGWSLKSWLLIAPPHLQLPSDLGPLPSTTKPTPQL